MDRLVPEFVDKEKFCSSYLKSLHHLCEKYTNAASLQQARDVVELDFSRQIYLKQGQIVNGDSDDDGLSESDSGDIVIHLTPKKRQNILPVNLDKLPTDTIELIPDNDSTTSTSPSSTPASLLSWSESKQMAGIPTPLLPSPRTPSSNTSLLAYRQLKNEALSGDKMLELFCTLSPADRKTRSPFLQRRHSETLERQLLSSLCSKTEQSMLSSDDDIVFKCRVVKRATTCSVGIQPKRHKSVEDVDELKSWGSLLEDESLLCLSPMERHPRTSQWQAKKPCKGLFEIQASKNVSMTGGCQ